MQLMLRRRAVVPDDSRTSDPSFRRPRVTPLAATGYALLLNSGATSVLGVAYWTLAARKYSAAVVGNSSAELSAIFLISGVTSLGTNAVLLRYLPQAGNSARRLILGTYGSSGGLAFLAALTVGLIDYRLLVPDGHAGAHALAIFAIAVATALWSISSLQDVALIGMRAAKWVVPENAIYSVVKLVLLGVLAGSAPRSGIIVSWTAPLVPVIFAITLLLFLRVIPGHVRSTPLELREPGIRELTRYAGGNWTGSIFLLVATTALPIMTLRLAGAHAAGYFYPPWSVMISLSLIAASLTVAMTVESARDGRQLAANGRRALLHTARLLIPTVAIVVIAAPLILDVFGPAYRSHGTLVLRLLALSTLPNVVLALALAVARVRHRNVAVVGMQAAVCALALGLGRLLLPRYGINGAAFAWLASQLAIALAVSPQLFRSLSRSAHSS
jgi:O-antigen/teichoic acid export membrane protein